VPRFTTSEPGPEFSPGQLAFAAVASLTIYAMFVFTQAVRHRDFFLPAESEQDQHGAADEDQDGHADPPTGRTALISLWLLILALVSAVRAASRRRVQTSLNLAYGSAMASIGLTIPTIVVASIWLEGPLTLGLGETDMVLLFASVIVGVLTVVPGRAKPLNGGLHLVILAAYIFLTISP
jgi:Ca2+:H+ antiporter